MFQPAVNLADCGDRFEVCMQPGYPAKRVLSDLSLIAELLQMMCAYAPKPITLAPFADGGRFGGEQFAAAEHFADFVTGLHQQFDKPEPNC